jgi:uncharacterized flavoprotein (TIGR03862 family)
LDEIRNKKIMAKKTISIIGGGSSSFMAADILSKKYKVRIYEKGKSIGRKFLVAGKGGFNLSHNLPYPEIDSKFSPQGLLSESLKAFQVDDLRTWYNDLGITTFVGSSNRVFPDKEFSPADVLKAIKAKMKEQKVVIKLNHEFIGFSKNNTPLIKYKETEIDLDSDYYIFALGGGSWKVTGANSDWLSHFDKIAVQTKPFESSNCGLNVDWPASVKEFHTGKPLKNIAITHQNFRIKGEAVISQYGLEGNAIYPISGQVRDSILEKATATITIDFKPNSTVSELYQRIKTTKPSNYGKKLHLEASKMAIIKSILTKDQFLDPELFVRHIKYIEIPVESLRPVEEAISTVGGICIDQLTPQFSLINHPNIYCMGEMVDWDAPTGGFLLQGCFSMGYSVANAILRSDG